ncbi:hypothetical protein ACVIHD_005979 [Bradyrhizobium embrapense]
MADQQSNGIRPLTVRGVYKFFKALESATRPDGKNALEFFLAECDQAKLTLGVSDALWSVGHANYDALIRINAAGPDCPACSGPPNL